MTSTRPCSRSTARPTTRSVGTGASNPRRWRSSATAADSTVPDVRGHVKVGRKVAGVGEDHRSARTHGQRGADELEHVDRDGVAANDTPRRRADQLADTVADSGGEAEPAIAVPRGDEVAHPIPSQPPLRRHGRQRPSAAPRANCRRGRRCRAAGRTDARRAGERVSGCHQMEKLIEIVPSGP